jgi:hypothetical protein
MSTRVGRFDEGATEVDAQTKGDWDMNHVHRLSFALLGVGCGAALVASAARAETVHANLNGFNETPSVSTVATGHFTAKIDEHAGTIFWELDYENLQADATQAHIHFGQRHVAGGITVWLCGNNPPTTPPPNTQACPARSAHLSGTIMAANVVGPGGAQQLPAGGFEQLVQAIRVGATYANVHSTLSPAGEIRGQIRSHDHDHH